MIAFITFESATGQRWQDEGRDTGVVCGVFFRKRAGRYETAELDPMRSRHPEARQGQQGSCRAPDVEFSEGAMACGDAFSSAC
jgi:hypothetical protein